VPPEAARAPGAQIQHTGSQSHAAS
jgi:hypothetical protein